MLQALHFPPISARLTGNRIAIIAFGLAGSLTFGVESAAAQTFGRSVAGYSAPQAVAGQPAQGQPAQGQPAQGQPAQAQPIQWLRSAERAAEVAAQTGKPILIYARSATCHYCDLMQRNVWENPTAASTVVRDFVPLKLTLEDNPEAMKVLKIKGYPSTMVFTPDRAYIGRIDGYVPADEFLNAMSRAKVAKSPIALQR